MNEFFGRSLTEKFIEQYGDKIIKDTLEGLKEENKKLKEEVKTRKMVADENGEHYDMMKDEYEKLEKENRLLECAINELMIQCDIKYFRFIDKEFYKQESPLSFISDKN